MSFFTNFWTHVKSVASGEAKSAGAFLKPLEDAIVANGESTVISAFEKGVLAAEMQGGTGVQKRDAAFQAVTADLFASGIKLAAPIINGGIEAAVVKLNSLKQLVNPLATPPVA